jgi:signal transduction histidine kinase
MSTEILLPALLLVLVSALILDLFLKSRHLSKIAKDLALIKQQEDSCNSTQKNRDEFTAMLVHELRSPLSVIKGASDLVLKETDKLSAEQIHNLLGQIRSSSDNLLSIVNDILDVSKMDAGKFEVDKAFGDFNELLSDECDYYSSMLGARNLDLATSFDESLPHFNFDSFRIKQVLNNLISNAIKYSPEGGKVTVSSASKSGYALVAVVDTGVGVPKEDQAKLFHKYMHPHNHQKTAGIPSTGLGLVISKGIIEAHGGSIWYEENVPKGSKFIFSLPLG